VTTLARKIPYSLRNSTGVLQFEKSDKSGEPIYGESGKIQNGTNSGQKKALVNEGKVHSS
jgi:hypothetical protein